MLWGLLRAPNTSIIALFWNATTHVFSVLRPCGLLWPSGQEARKARAGKQSTAHSRVGRYSRFACIRSAHHPHSIGRPSLPVSESHDNAFVPPHH
ncbi:hypothetical protein FIBSPDRAFT_483175 [Athelia psychrophila]|uniref:Uncharacterized protein n=1 Tax=Athelia psychrophila TaxID=1759441 RepID=A0A166L1C0_9AGAM|nr:hypothetical protein FIBSPDRAFT_483175 [Fibularhizoctonia sp. CBS 109695]